VQITVRYFAALREQAGTDTQELAWEGPPPTVMQVRERLARAYPELASHLLERPLLVAVNREYAGADAVLADGDELALLPPVTGG
jgi:molybdopterin converting factor subunit 1